MAGDPDEPSVGDTPDSGASGPADDEGATEDPEPDDADGADAADGAPDDDREDAAGDEAPADGTAGNHEEPGEDDVTAPDEDVQSGDDAADVDRDDEPGDDAEGADGDADDDRDDEPGDDAAGVDGDASDDAVEDPDEGGAEPPEPGDPAVLDPPPEPVAEPRTCAGVTKDGVPCGRRIGADRTYCYLHEDQAGGGSTDEEDVAEGDAVRASPVSESALPYESDPLSGPAQDQEMPLADHIEEMLKRLAVVIAVAGLVSLVTFPFADTLINVIWNGVLPAGEVTRPRLYGILELKLTELKVASLFGLVVALPVLVYETYQFMRPGLYPHERRYYLAAIPTSLVLALVGVSFAYFVVLPVIFTYFLYYSQDVATIGFALGRTFDLILLLMGYLAVVFQIPLFIMLAMMMGLVTRRWLADRRLLFWGAFLGISFLFSPDPTGMAPVVVALTMIVLFEGTLLLAKWTRRGRGRSAESATQS